MLSSVGEKNKQLRYHIPFSSGKSPSRETYLDPSHAAADDSVVVIGRAEWTSGCALPQEVEGTAITGPIRACAKKQRGDLSSLAGSVEKICLESYHHRARLVHLLTNLLASPGSFQLGLNSGFALSFP